MSGVHPVLMPVVAWQGMRVKRTTERLPEAGGPTSGTTSYGAQGGVRLAVVGESTAAGCGAESHREAFAGRLAAHLAAATDRTVHWEVHGRNGATLGAIRHELVPHVSTGLDVAVLLAGVNDVLGGTSAADWERRLDAVCRELRRRAGRVVMTGVPPFDAFPTLPRVLGRYLRGRGDRLDAVSRGVCARLPDTTWVGGDEVLPSGREFFARDGFHPSPEGYAVWAGSVGDRLLEVAGDSWSGDRRDGVGR